MNAAGDSVYHGKAFLCPKGMVIRMKAMQKPLRTVAQILALAVILSTMLLCSVACTRGDGQGSDTTTGDSTPSTTTGNGQTTTPMDPDAGTVNPDGDAGNPPAGTDTTPNGRNFRSDFMH